MILSHPAVKNVACIRGPRRTIWARRMCACVILRDGADADVRRTAVSFLIGKEIAKFKLPGAAGDHGRLPALHVRESLEERSRRAGRGARVVRIIDLHCYPNTTEWIACQQPYIDALAQYWNRPWTAKAEDDVVAAVHRGRRRSGARRARSGNDRAHAALFERFRARHAAAPSRSHHPVVGGRRSVQGRSGDRRGPARDSRPRNAGVPFPPDHGALRGQRSRVVPALRAIDELKVPVMIDVGTTGMGAGMPGGMGAKIRHAHPAAIDELAADFPNLHHRRGASGVAVGRRDDRRRPYTRATCTGSSRAGHPSIFRRN